MLPSNLVQIEWQEISGNTFATQLSMLTTYFANQQHIRRPAYHQNQFGGTIGGPVVIPKIYNGRNKTFFFFDYQGTRIDTPSSYQEYVPTMNIRNSNFTNYQDYFTIATGTKTDALGTQIPLCDLLRSGYHP